MNASNMNSRPAKAGRTVPKGLPRPVPWSPPHLRMLPRRRRPTWLLEGARRPHRAQQLPRVQADGGLGHIIRVLWASPVPADRGAPGTSRKVQVTHVFEAGSHAERQVHDERVAGRCGVHGPCDQRALRRKYGCSWLERQRNKANAARSSVAKGRIAAHQGVRVGDCPAPEEDNHVDGMGVGPALALADFPNSHLQVQHACFRGDAATQRGRHSEPSGNEPREATAKNEGAHLTTVLSTGWNAERTTTWTSHSPCTGAPVVAMPPITAVDGARPAASNDSSFCRTHATHRRGMAEDDGVVEGLPSPVVPARILVRHGLGVTEQATLAAAVRFG